MSCCKNPLANMVKLIIVCRCRKFFWFLLFSFLTLAFYTFYGQMCLAISPDLGIAAVVSTVACAPLLCLAALL